MDGEGQAAASKSEDGEGQATASKSEDSAEENTLPWSWGQGQLQSLPAPSLATISSLLTSTTFHGKGLKHDLKDAKSQVMGQKWG